MIGTAVRFAMEIKAEEEIQVRRGNNFQRGIPQLKVAIWQLLV